MQPLIERQALIDGDILHYEIGFSAEYEEIDEKTGEKVGLIREWDFVEELLNNKIKIINEDIEATLPPKIFITGSKNVARILGVEYVEPIRNGIAITKPYKGTRKNAKPFHFNNITAYLLANYDCDVAWGLEADDKMALYQINNAKEYGVRVITNNGDTFLDYEDWLKYHNQNLSLNDSGYMVWGKRDDDGRNITFRLHRQIMNEPENFVDHINGCKLDNRKYNLRECSNKENVRNSKSREGTSNFKGVSFSKDRNKWQATIQVDGKSIGLGRYDLEIEAAKAYDEAAKKYFGEFAFLNLEEPPIKPLIETVICSRDKDLKMVPLWQYSWECGKQPSFGPEFVNPKGWLKLSNDRKSIKGTGLKFFFSQILTGDTVDNIPGCPKMGPVKAFEILSECNTKHEHELAIIEAYKKAYPDNWQDMIEEQSKLLWMVRELNEDGTPIHYEWKFE